MRRSLQAWIWEIINWPLRESPSCSEKNWLFKNSIWTSAITQTETSAFWTPSGRLYKMFLWTQGHSGTHELRKKKKKQFQIRECYPWCKARRGYCECSLASLHLFCFLHFLVSSTGTTAPCSLLLNLRKWWQCLCVCSVVSDSLRPHLL